MQNPNLAVARAAAPVGADIANFLSKTRKKIASYDFDAASFVGQQISSTIDALDTAEPEQLLLSLFDQLTNDFTLLSQQIEDDVTNLQRRAMETEEELVSELESNSTKLNAVGEAVDQVKLSFDLASEGAVRIGGKLSAAERERAQIDKSIELMGYIKQLEQLNLDEITGYNRSGGETEEIHTINNSSNNNNNNNNNNNIINNSNSSAASGGRKTALTTSQLKEALPTSLKDKDWGTISYVMYDLRRILFELNSDETRNAEVNMFKIADKVEMELLEQFNLVVLDLMHDRDNSTLLDRARELAEWCHLYSYGHNIQRRFIFSVIQHRLRGDSNYQLHSQSQSHIGFSSGSGDASDSPSNRQQQQQQQPRQQLQRRGLQESASSMYSKSGDGASGFSRMDHLSLLFATINEVCQEQFVIIRKVFPLASVPRVTRLLIQRIFNDPACGIQARVDAILNPIGDTNRGGNSSGSMLLSEYLDALVTVREKLSALYVLLLECSSHPAMRGMGSESAAMKRAKYFDVRARAGTQTSILSYNGSNNSGNGNGNGGYETTAQNATADSASPNSALIQQQQQQSGGFLIDPDEEADEQMQSDAEIREFFDDQIAQVLTHYISDYFEKEALNVRIQFVEHLRIAVQDSSSLLTRPHGFDNTVYCSATAVSSSSSSYDNCYGKTPQEQVLLMPTLRHDRLKSIAQVNKAVANRVFLNRMFSITTDAVTRMESIGRDDRHLTARIKDLFLFLLGFISECILMPAAKACNALLLRWRSQIARNNSSSSGGAEQLPTDAMQALSAFTFGVHRLRSHFDEVFARPLSAAPNTIAVCKESRQRMFRALEVSARELLHAWTLCVVASFERILTTLQSKFDFAPKFEAASRAAMSSAQSIFNKSNIAISSPAATTTAATTAGIAAAVGAVGVAAAGTDAAGAVQQLKATTACEAACSALFAAVNAVRSQESSLYGLNLTKLFWIPLGAQLAAVLISHFRKQHISLAGAKYLVRDLREYCRYVAMFDSAEITDTFVCLKELCSKIFFSEPDKLVRLVTEELRYLDTGVLLALVKARADFNLRDASGWAANLSDIFSTYKWDSALPWELNRQISLQEFTDSVASGGRKGVQLGPYSLRRAAALHGVTTAATSSNSNTNSSSGGNRGDGITITSSTRPISALFMKEIARTSTSTASQLAKGGRSVAVDLAAYEEMGADNSSSGGGIDHLPASAFRPATAAAAGRSRGSSQQQQQQQHYGRGGGSQFLPSRPDDAAFLQRQSQQQQQQRRSLLVSSTDLARPDLVEGNVTAFAFADRSDPIARAAKLDSRASAAADRELQQRTAHQQLQPHQSAKQYDSYFGGSSSSAVGTIRPSFDRAPSASAPAQQNQQQPVQQKRVLQKISSIFNFQK